MKLKEKVLFANNDTLQKLLADNEFYGRLAWLLEEIDEALRMIGDDGKEINTLTD